MLRGSYRSPCRHAVSPHEKTTVDPDAERLATERRARRAGPLRVDMKMRLTGVPAITDATDQIAHGHMLRDVHHQRPLLQMTQQYPGAAGSPGSTPRARRPKRLIAPRSVPRTSSVGLKGPPACSSVTRW